jgi:hypothetical protein
MKTFIIKTFTALAIPIFLFVGAGTYFKFKISNDIANYQIFILGDSQTEFINFPEIYNRSIHGSPYYVHYEFAKEFISSLKGKKIYIACNYHNLSNLYQNRLSNDSLMPGWRANTFQTLDEYNLINHKYSDIRPIDLEYSFLDIKKFSRLIKKLYFSKENKNIQSSVINDTLSINNAIFNHWKNPKYILKDSIQKTYLDKLIRLLAVNNCEIILLKMPLTNFYIDNVPFGIKRQLAQLPYAYKIRLLDLNNALKISKDYNLFKDYGHLNSKGDLLITEYFRNYVIEAQTQKSLYK